jgi:uncharacterized protein YvpB
MPSLQQAAAAVLLLLYAYTNATADFAASAASVYCDTAVLNTLCTQQCRCISVVNACSVLAVYTTLHYACLCACELPHL